MALASPFVISLDEGQRAEPERVAVSRIIPAGQVQRARALLAAADGVANAEIARRLGRHEDTIRNWRRRFLAEGMAAPGDRPRPLGRPRYSPQDRLRIIAAATAVPPGADTVWTHRRLADHLAEIGVSACQIGRILGGADLKPHLVRGWLTRPADPEFFTKAADVCALYRACPPGALVLSVDEKTGITARSRKHPDQPERPDRRTRREFERHGTVSIIAALNVHTGQVLTERIERNNDDTFIAFLRLLEATVDKTLRSGHGQRLVAHGEKDPGLAGRASTVPRPLDTQARVLAQPSRAVLLHSHPQGPASGVVHLA
jgi:transposase